jgi:hypothetical protein
VQSPLTQFGFVPTSVLPDIIAQKQLLELLGYHEKPVMSWPADMYSVCSAAACTGLLRRILWELRLARSASVYALFRGALTKCVWMTSKEGVHSLNNL